MTAEITLRNLQERIDAWIRTYGVRYFSELTNLAVLMEEVGEVARIMSRRFGDQSSKGEAISPDLADELADVLFVTVCIANQTGIDLTAAIEANLRKKNRPRPHPPSPKPQTHDRQTLLGKLAKDACPFADNPANGGAQG